MTISLKGLTIQPIQLCDEDIMKNRNTMQPREYLFDNLFWAITAMIWYRNIFFVGIPGISVGLSKLILWCIVFAFVALGYIITFQRRRNSVSLIVNILLPYEVYTVVAYHTYIPKLVLWAIILSAVVSLAFLSLAVMPYNDSKKKQPSLKRRFKHGLLGSRTLVAVCMLALLVPLGIKLIFGHGLITPVIQSVSSSAKASEWTVKNNIETVRLLEEEEWCLLTSQEKMDVLGVILNIEIRYLGLNHELYLKSAVLDGHTAAHYNHSNHEIVIDIDCLQSEPPEEILDSLCHECYHSYQYQMIELYDATPDEYKDMLLFQYVDDYIDEFSDYTDGSENIEGYYFQTVEIAARQYAAQSVEEYYDLIDEYTSSDE